MGLSYSRTTLAVAVCGAALLATSVRGVAQQPAPAAPQGQPGAGRAGGGGGGRGGVAPALFTAADGNKDGAVSRDELKGDVRSWFTAADTSKAGAVTRRSWRRVWRRRSRRRPLPRRLQPGQDCGGRSANPPVAVRRTSQR